MTALPIVIAPDPRLKTRSAPVEAITPDIRALVQDMFDTMYAEKGIGLAAVQVGVMKRVVVIDIDWREGGEAGKQYVFINPELVESSKELNTYKEGCLSFPDQFSDVERPSEVRVRYLDLDGNQQELACAGLLATCIQHEIDHLNGKVFVDHISRLKRDMIIKRLQKLKKLGAFDHDHHHHDHVHGPNCNH